MIAKNYVEHETIEVEEHVKHVSMDPVYGEIDSLHTTSSIDDRIKQSDIIKEAGSVILSTCYETSVPGDAVVEAYEETVNCGSPSSFINASDAEESQIDSDHDEIIASNEQVTIVDKEVDQQPLIKKKKLWDERDVM